MNRSEELAKLLGIKPKAKKDCNNCPHKRLSAAGVDTCNFSNTYCKYTDILECNLTTYPDFTKPDNFVKLYEMPIQDLGNGIIRTLGKLVKPVNDRNDFIENIFKRAEDDNSLGGNFWKVASEFAQQVDWSY